MKKQVDAAALAFASIDGMVKLVLAASLWVGFAAVSFAQQQPPPAPPPGMISGATTATQTGVVSGTTTGTETAQPGQSPVQILPGMLPSTPYKLIPMTPATLSPGVLHLLQLEGEFQQAVAKGGGKAFVTWFAEDAVVLNNGKPAILGRGALASQADWDPKSYQLNWAPEGAQMGPSGDMGFTWGRYTGKALDPQGHASVNTGRYISIWKREKDGTWKVAMDASADAPPVQ